MDLAALVSRLARGAPDPRADPGDEDPGAPGYPAPPEGWDAAMVAAIDWGRERRAMLRRGLAPGRGME